MRKQLKKLDEIRDTFSGTLVRIGTKNGWNKVEQTILLKDVKNKDGIIVTDHLWFNYTKGFQALGLLQEGDIIEFCARVKRYIKGYQGYREDVFKPIETDYKLSYPTGVRKLGQGERFK